MRTVPVAKDAPARVPAAPVPEKRVAYAAAWKGVGDLL